MRSRAGHACEKSADFRYLFEQRAIKAQWVFYNELKERMCDFSMGVCSQVWLVVRVKERERVFHSVSVVTLNSRRRQQTPKAARHLSCVPRVLYTSAGGCVHSALRLSSREAARHLGRECGQAVTDLGKVYQNQMVIEKTVISCFLSNSEQDTS